MSLASRLGLPPARTDNLPPSTSRPVEEPPRPEPPRSPWVRRALARELPASDRTGLVRRP